MFSGIIQTTGTITHSIQHHTQDLTLTCSTPTNFLKKVSIGESIAVQGVCLTITSFTHHAFTVDISLETLSRTYFSTLQPGKSLNLERSLTLQTPLNGHWVLGHGDGIGNILNRKTSGRSTLFEVLIPKKLMRYMAEKGSVCLDGVSLTINSLTSRSILVNCIPQTLLQTTLGDWRKNSPVHIEVDVIARYIEQLCTHRKH